MRWQRLYNPIVGSLLRSPLHGLMSGSTMLITFAGCKSGKNYTTPVNYVADGDDLLAVSRDERLWWRNLRGGGPVGVRVRGRTLKGVGEAMEGEEAVEDGGLLTVLRKVPAYRRYWGVRLDANGRPEHPQALTRISRTNVLVRVRDPTPSRRPGGEAGGVRKPGEIARRVCGAGGFLPGHAMESVGFGYRRGGVRGLDRWYAAEHPRSRAPRWSTLWLP